MSKVQVRLRSIYASPSGVTGQPGQVINVDGAEAKALIDGGYAEPVKHKTTTAPQSEGKKAKGKKAKGKKDKDSEKSGDSDPDGSGGSGGSGETSETPAAKPRRVRKTPPKND